MKGHPTRGRRLRYARPDRRQVPASMKACPARDNDDAVKRRKVLSGPRASMKGHPARDGNTSRTSTPSLSPCLNERPSLGSRRPGPSVHLLGDRVRASMKGGPIRDCDGGFGWRVAGLPVRALMKAVRRGTPTEGGFLAEGVLGGALMKGPPPRDGDLMMMLCAVGGGVLPR
jgi:hypothetical protein